jgi:hypothetical protein
MPDQQKLSERGKAILQNLRELNFPYYMSAVDLEGWVSQALPIVEQHEGVCEWVPYYDPDYLQTSCGQEYDPEIWAEGKTPALSGYEFCPNCGKRLSY